MKKITFVFILISGMIASYGQKINISFTAYPELFELQKEIALIEGKECEAVYKKDTDALQQIWANTFINRKIDTNDIAHVSRELKTIWKTNDGLVYSTGEEVLVPLSRGTQSISVTKIGFTHIWEKQYGGWRLLNKYMFTIEK